MGPFPTHATNANIQSRTNPISNNTGDNTNDASDNEPCVKDTGSNKPKPSIKHLKKQNISTIFNYSRIEMSEPMTKLLNRGLNFTILPLKLDLTEVIVDYNKFE